MNTVHFCSSYIIPSKSVFITLEILYASLLNTQNYKVRIKGKRSNPKEGVMPSTVPLCSYY